MIVIHIRLLINVCLCFILYNHLDNDMNKTEELLGRKSKSFKKSPEGIKEENDSAL